MVGIQCIQYHRTLGIRSSLCSVIHLHIYVFKQHSRDHLPVFLIHLHENKASAMVLACMGYHGAGELWTLDGSAAYLSCNESPYQNILTGTDDIVEERQLALSLQDNAPAHWIWWGQWSEKLIPIACLMKLIFHSKLQPPRLRKIMWCWLGGPFFHPFPSFNGCSVHILEWMLSSQYWTCDYLSFGYKSSSILVKTGPK